MRASFGHGGAIGIGDPRQCRIGLRKEGRVVELVSAQGRPGAMPLQRGRKARPAIANRQPALHVGGDKTQQPRHRMAVARCVVEAARWRREMAASGTVQSEPGRHDQAEDRPDGASPRPDPRLFDDGDRLSEARIGWRGFGMTRWSPEASRLPAEDAPDLGATGAAPAARAHAAKVEATPAALAAHLEAHVNVSALFALAR